MCRGKKNIFFFLSNESYCIIRIITTLKRELGENQNPNRKYSRGIFLILPKDFILNEVLNTQGQANNINFTVVFV